MGKSFPVIFDIASLPLLLSVEEIGYINAHSVGLDGTLLIKNHLYFSHLLIFIRSHMFVIYFMPFLMLYFLLFIVFYFVPHLSTCASPQESRFPLTTGEILV